MLDKKFLALLTLLFTVLFSTFSGLPQDWLVRAGVITDDFNSAIDSLLGEEKLIRKEAELAIVTLDEEIEQLHEWVATSRVDKEMVGEKLLLLNEQVITLQETLAQLADWIEAGEPLQLADGNRWQISDLQSYAQAQMEKLKVLKANQKVYEQAVTLHQQNEERFYAQLQKAEQNKSNMAAKLELLNAQLQLLTNLRQQAALQKSAEAAGAVQQAGTLIDELLAEVERATRITAENNTLADVSTGVGELPLVGPTSGDALVSELRELAGQSR